MKITLSLSVLVNATLLVALFVLWHKPRIPAAKPTLLTIMAASPPVSSKLAPAVIPTFRWTQLDSPDYHLYVKNLRAIGCPEGSLRAIVTADADVVYNLRRVDLERRLAESSRGSLSNQLAMAGSVPPLQAALQHLPVEEAGLIAELLGSPQTQSQIANVPLQPPLTATQDPAAMPLVFQEFDPAALGLSDEQTATIARLRQNFLDEISSTSQDPHDPAYLARWQSSQVALDNMLQGMLGGDVFIKFQMLQLMAENQTAAPRAPN